MENQFEYLGKGAYRVEKVDTDYMPVGIQWQEAGLEECHPVLFFIATCSNCFYSTEFNNEFRNWKENNQFRSYSLPTIKEKHLEELNKPENLLSHVGAALDPQEYPNETAILKLILAVFDELLNSRPSFLRMARYYLRIGWVFRYMSGKRPEFKLSDTANLMAGLRKHLDGVDTNLIRLSSALTNLTSFCDNNAEELYPYIDKLTKAGVAQKYQEFISEVISATEGVKNKQEQLRNLNERVLKNVSEAERIEQMRFQGFPNFNTYLQVLTETLPEIPLSEKDALSIAKNYYKKSIRSRKEIKGAVQEINTFYLIGELSRRIGNLKEAKEYLGSAITRGRKLLNEKVGTELELKTVKNIVDKALIQVKPILENKGNQEVKVG
ncbi:MAG: DUF2225 domain-containing protein [candidate division Zixibacteria bacterium]|nr:DUF2225 domain-containing protein [candidate division Zixibacteria bacterium]